MGKHADETPPDLVTANEPSLLLDVKPDNASVFDGEKEVEGDVMSEGEAMCRDSFSVKTLKTRAPRAQRYI
jgi:hypothetical protein